MKTNLLLALSAPLLLVACTRCTPEPVLPGMLSVMSYNLQTMFDPVDQGTEYDDFSVADGTWSADAYAARLEAVASVIESSPATEGGGLPDVLVVQEAENLRVLKDLADELGGYPTVVCSPDEEGALRCGVLSRFPLVSARAHRAVSDASLDAGSAGGHSGRFMLDVELDVDGHRLVVLAVHLKSKLGGAAETEAERAAGMVLAALVAERRLAENSGAAVIIAGDFNENPDEYDRVSGAYPTAVMPAGAGTGRWLRVDGASTSFSGAAGVAGIGAGLAGATDGVRGAGDDAAEPGNLPSIIFYNPWDEAGGYSYRYDGEEERIDMILVSPSVADGTAWLAFESFTAEPPDFATDSRGNPLGWRASTGTGYSDHLPVRASFRVMPD